MGPLMLDLTGYEITPEEMEILEHPLIGGVILFSRNYHDQPQLRELVRQTRKHSRNRIMIAVDHEGGRVQRFRQDFSPIPAMGSIFTKVTQKLNVASDYAKHFGWLMASEVLAMDIDFSFAPVLDIWGNSDVIGDRSFHQKPDIVIRLASHFIQGMHQAGMKATGKHFPGHGNVKEDSHFALPIDNRPADEIFNFDMRIFKEIHEQGLLDAVMPAHVIYSDVDNFPAGFSNVWLRDILRKKLNFDGVVFSDDLAMEGATKIGDFGERAKVALSAGCDMVLVCNHRDGAVKVLDSLPIDYIPSPRLERMCKNPKGEYPGSMEELQSSYLWKQAQEKLESFDES